MNPSLESAIQTGLTAIQSCAWSSAAKRCAAHSVSALHIALAADALSLLACCAQWVCSLDSTDAGLSKLCQDLGVDPADIVMLIISFYCEVSSPTDSATGPDAAAYDPPESCKVRLLCNISFTVSFSCVTWPLHCRRAACMSGQRKASSCRWSLVNLLHAGLLAALQATCTTCLLLCQPCCMADSRAPAAA